MSFSSQTAFRVMELLKFILPIIYYRKHNKRKLVTGFLGLEKNIVLKMKGTNSIFSSHSIAKILIKFNHSSFSVSYSDINQP